MMIDTSHYYRQHWYWAGEASYRLTGKLELTTIPAAEWKQVETDAVAFWDEIAKQSERSARVVEIIKKYNADMELAGPPYRSKIGRAHVCTPVTNAQFVCRILLETKKKRSER